MHVEHLSISQLAKRRSIRSSKTDASGFFEGILAAILAGEITEMHAQPPSLVAVKMISMISSSMADFSTIGRTTAFASPLASLPVCSSQRVSCVAQYQTFFVGWGSCAHRSFGQQQLVICRRECRNTLALYHVKVSLLVNRIGPEI